MISNNYASWTSGWGNLQQNQLQELYGQTQNSLTESSNISTDEESSERENWDITLLNYLGDTGYESFIESTSELSESDRYSKAAELDYTASQLAQAMSGNFSASLAIGDTTSTDMSDLLYQNMLNTVGHFNQQENINSLQQLAESQDQTLYSFLTGYTEYVNTPRPLDIRV